MNCQDISRMINSGSFGELAYTDRQDAKAHALSCDRCAPAWAAHAGIAELPPSPMPPEMAERCLALWTQSAAPTGRVTARRLTLVGSVVAVAAAAGGLALWMAGEPVAEEVSIEASVLAAPPTPAPTLPSVVVAAELTEVPEVSPPAVVANAADDAPRELPLIPVPSTDFGARMILAIEKALERHPEMFEGPLLDGTNVVAMTMRDDGHVISSVLRYASAQDYQNVSAELERSVPRDGSGSGTTRLDKEVPRADGRTLRADVALRVAFVPDNYDVTRSSLRVLEIVGDRYEELMLPATGGELNRAVIFLSEDGAILKEVIERTAPGTSTGPLPADPAAIASIAAQFASQVEVGVEQIGRMGNAAIERGTTSVLVDQNGNARPNDNRQMMLVRFAWQRREGESAPSLGQGGARSPARVDQADAMIVVEHLIPDAFTRNDPSAGTPTVVLTAEGAVIRAGRVHLKVGEPIDKLLQDQLVPGVETSSFSTVRLTDKNGVTVNVTFAWVVPKRQ